jgi:hypothetical protein
MGMRMLSSCRQVRAGKSPQVPTSRGVCSFISWPPNKRDVRVLLNALQSVTVLGRQSPMFPFLKTHTVSCESREVAKNCIQSEAWRNGVFLSVLFYISEPSHLREGSRVAEIIRDCRGVCKGSVL